MDSTTTSITDHPELAGMHQVGARQPMRRYLANIWDRREYAFHAPVGDLESQHRDTVLGNAWHVLSPLLLMGVYWMVFGGLLRTTRGLEGHAFVAFLAAGMLPFQYTQKSFLSGSTAISRNLGLLRTIAFPRALLPLTEFMAETLAYLVSAMVMVAVVLLAGEGVSLRWLVLPAIFALQAAFNVGGSLVSARIGAMFTDFANLLPFVFRLLIYLSGIFYLIDGYVDNSLALTVFRLNPIFAIVSLYRWVLLGLDVSTVSLVSALAWSTLLPVVGLFFFRAGEDTYGR